MVCFVSRAMSLCFMAGVMLGPGRAMADGALIWTPVKVTPEIYQTTLGLKLPLPVDASAGANFGLGNDADDKLSSDSELATLWGKIVDNSTTPGGSNERALVVSVDTLHGDGDVLLSHSRSWIYSPDLDLQASRSLSLNYGVTGSETTSVSASQALTMTYGAAGTAVSASGTLTSGVGGGLTGTLALSQPVAPHLDFTASVDSPVAEMPTGDVQMHYQIKW